MRNNFAHYWSDYLFEKQQIECKTLNYRSGMINADYMYDPGRMGSSKTNQGLKCELNDLAEGIL